MIDRKALTAARKAKGISQPELARAVGCSYQLIQALEAGTTQTTKFLPKLALALDVPVATIDPDWGAVEGDRPAIIPESRLFGAARDLPVYASAEGGPGEILRSIEPVDWIPRPEQVARVQGAYGLHIVGESMAPEFEPGDVALINPALPIIANVTCIFYAEKDGEARATIKRLRRATADSWLLRQWNPPEGMKSDFSLSRKEWPICHRALGKYYRQ